MPGNMCINCDSGCHLGLVHWPSPVHQGNKGSHSPPRMRDCQESALLHNQLFEELKRMKRGWKQMGYILHCLLDMNMYIWYIRASLPHMSFSWHIMLTIHHFHILTLSKSYVCPLFFRLTPFFIQFFTEPFI